MRRNLRSAIAALALAIMWHISPAQAQELQTIDLQPNNIQLTSNWTDGNVAAGCTDNSCCEAVKSCDSCCDNGGFVGGIEFLILKAHLAGATGPLGGLANSQGPTWDWEVAPRIWFGKENAEGLGVRLRYFQFDHTASNGGSLGGTALISGLEMHTLDAEIYQMSQIQRVLLQGGAGIRYSSIERSTSGAGALGGSLTLQHDGVGPTVFLNAFRPFGDHGLAFYAGGRGSLTYGDQKLNVGGLNARYQDQLVSILEASLGIQWTSESGKFFARSGFEAQSWHLGQPNSNLSIPLITTLGNATDVGLVGASLAIGIRH